jgi:hypothetical protein
MVLENCREFRLLRVEALVVEWQVNEFGRVNRSLDHAILSYTIPIWRKSSTINKCLHKSRLPVRGGGENAFTGPQPFDPRLSFPIASEEPNYNHAMTCGKPK